MRKIFLTIVAAGIFAVTAYAQHEHRHHISDPSGDEPEHVMQGLYGLYPAAREASGTSWQPDSSPHEGVHFQAGDWSWMAHGFVTGIYDYQEGDRGDEKFFSSNMFMLMGRRPLGKGTWGLRGMFSLEPITIGKKGYPLLLQTGETADGQTPLIDRQHPHDFFMELATSYSHPLNEDSSVFAYFGLPGEPALGPPAFMHRFSGMEIPEAPLSHHWLDSTHITFGVATLGYVWSNVKVEGSVFRGREPDEKRWDIEAPEFDSYSGRLTFNPFPNWSLQASYGDIKSPEQLHPHVDTERLSFSATYNKPLEWGNWQTTFAWGQNSNDPGAILDAYLLESALNINKTHTLLGRIEQVEKNELFTEEPLEHEIFDVTKVSLGYIYDFPEKNNMQWGIGGLAGIHFLPDRLEDFYGENPMSYMAFLRLKI